MERQKMRTVKICPNCGSVLIPSFALRGSEYVCVPCGEGFPFFNNCEEKQMPVDEYNALREKYKDDLGKISLQTAKAGGGKCNTCGTAFNCENCKRLEKHKLQYFGKGTVRNVDSRIG